MGKGCFSFAQNQFILLLFFQDNILSESYMFFQFTDFFFCFKMVIHMLKSQPSEPSNAGGKMKAGNYKMSWTIDCYLVHRKQKKKSWWKQTQRIKFWLSTMSNQVGFYSTLWNPVNSTVIVCTAVTEKPWGQGMLLCKYRGYFAVVYDKSLRWDSETVVASTYWGKS